MEIKRPKTEAERLEEYFDKLPIPWPTPKEMECLSRPCKWKKLLEEQAQKAERNL